MIRPDRLLFLNATTGKKSITGVLCEQFIKKYRNKVSVDINSIDLWHPKLERFDLPKMEAAYRLNTGTGSEKDKMIMKPIERMARDLVNTDMLLIGCPMWNYSMPFVLKQYIDCVIQPGISFRMKDKPTREKHLVFITSAGGQVNKDFLKPLVQQVFQLVGFHHMHYVAIQQSSQTDRKNSLEQAEMQIEHIIQEITRSNTQEVEEIHS